MTSDVTARGRDGYSLFYKVRLKWAGTVRPRGDGNRRVWHGVVCCGVAWRGVGRGGAGWDGSRPNILVARQGQREDTASKAFR